MNKQYSIADLYAEYLTTAELVRNRPDAVATTHSTGKNRSIFQRKLAGIKRYAESMTPSNPTEKVFLEAILGRKIEEKNKLVKVEWFQLGS